MQCNPSIFWRVFQIIEYKILVHYFFPRNFPGNIKFPKLPDIGEFQIFQVYSGGKYSREILNMLESSLNQKIVRTLYISKGYSMFGELIDYFKCPSQTIFPDWK